MEEHVVRALALLFGLTVLHVVSDWGFQNQKEAMTKATNGTVRLWHCVKYGAPFIVVMLLCGWSTAAAALGYAWLVGSHWVEDSYYPVILWAKYLRRLPTLQEKRPARSKYGVLDDDAYRRGIVDWKYRQTKAFKEWVSTPLGLLLAITIDQLIHVLCLIPIVWFL